MENILFLRIEMNSIRRWWKHTNLPPIGKPRTAYIVDVFSSRNNADLAINMIPSKLRTLWVFGIFAPLSWHLACRAEMGLRPPLFF